MDDIRPLIPGKPVKLLDQVRRHMRDGGYTWKTEKTYLHWIRRFILFHSKQHPASMSARHIEEFLSNLANERNCSPATQRIALNALVYLFRKFLCVELEALAFEKARIKPRLPVVLTHAEAMLVIGHMRGIHQTMASLLYGSGLRLNELLSLRVKDIDFEMSTITVRSGKGDKDRTTLLPQQLKPQLQEQIVPVDKLHRRDLEDGFGEVYLPYALARKYPSAAKELGWQFVFPSSAIAVDPRTGVLRRHHQHESSLRKAVSLARRETRITKHVKCHTFRHAPVAAGLRHTHDPEAARPH